MVQLKFKSQKPINQIWQNKSMDSSDSKCKSKNKNWNIFRSPEQKDLFDFLDRQQNNSFNQNHSRKDKFVDGNVNRSKQHDKSEDFLESINNGIFLNTQRSNMTFATRYMEQNSSKISSDKGQLFFRAPTNKTKQRISQFQQQKIFTSRPKDQDSFSNIFLKQMKTEQHQNLSTTDPQKRKLFENMILRTSHNADFNQVNQEMILRTLNEIKQINKENLFVNKRILQVILQATKRGKSSKKQKNKPNPVTKDTEKKNQQQKSTHQKGFSQSRNQFYLYEKAPKQSSHSKLSHNKSTIIKKHTLNTTNNVTKLSLNHNTTKLSLGDRTQPSIKRNPLNQSKSTIKKPMGNKKLPNLILDDHLPSKMLQINKIKTSLNMFIKENSNHIEQTLPKASNKRKSKSQFIIRC